MHKLSWRQQLLSQGALGLLGVFVLVPIWAMAFLAFDGAVKGWPTYFAVWPRQPTLDVIWRMWLNPSQNLSFLGLLRNSLTVAGGAALLSTALGASMAYAFARYRFPGRRVGLFALLVGTLLPPVALMTPLYILLTVLHLRTTLLGLTLVYTAFSMPFCVWNMRAAFQSVPNELEESAFLDGASAWTAFWRVTLPLALPAIAIAAIVAFLLGYTEFALGWLFVSKGQDVTLAMAVSGIFGGASPVWSRMAALALMMSAPVVALFLVLQKYLLNGLSLGTVEE
jgi:arabinogalactan oligomer/maltooligosaccharide transport system permease protein